VGYFSSRILFFSFFFFEVIRADRHGRSAVPDRSILGEMSDSLRSLKFRYIVENHCFTGNGFILCSGRHASGMLLRS